MTTEETVVNVQLYDQKTDKYVPAAIRIDGGVAIHVSGYGEATAEDGHGEPIFIEVYDGRLQVHLWTDINREDPETIDMGNAREDLREAE